MTGNKVLRWIICNLLNDWQYVERLAPRWMICTTFNDFYKDKEFLSQYYWGVSPPPFSWILKISNLIFLSIRFISHLKCWFKNIYNPGHNILAIFHVLRQGWDLISSIKYFLHGLPHKLSNELRRGILGN